MPDSSQPNNSSTATTESKDSSLNWGPDSECQGKNATMLVQNSCTPSEIRLEKVRAIQLLFAEAGYKLDEQQNANLKQLLENLNA
jgi:hypothetical protein